VRVIVTGGRDFSDESLLLDALMALPHGTILVHGAARGLDKMAAELWRTWGETDEPHPARWEADCDRGCPGHRKKRGDGSSYCPAAGVLRNKQMVDMGADKILAFPGSSGTADCVRQAKAAGIWVEFYGEKAETH
jgi:hypothetical protein